MKEQLIYWLEQQKDILDDIIYQAALQFYNDNCELDNFEFDFGTCQVECYDLIKGKDLCYDRPSIAFSYALWYHARRVNTFLSHFVKSFITEHQDTIEIFDLGAGTGAIQWALGLVVAGMGHLNMKPPKLKIINIDSSPFMLEYGSKYLWPKFVEKYPICSQIKVSYCVNSWNNPDNISVNDSWIASSYLFDISDNEITKSFLDIVNTFKPKKLLLLTSNQEKKKVLLKKINLELIQVNYQSSGTYALENKNLIFSGELSKTTHFRKELFKKYSVLGMDRSAVWGDYSFIGLTLETITPSLSIGSSLKLFIVSEKNRQKIRLTTEQLEISKHKDNDRPTIITGPAGCGKSVVLTERIKNLIEKRNYDPSLRILVTTFNKNLIEYLGNWIESLLHKSVKRVKVSTEPISYFRFEGATKRNIDVLHFDVLPTRLQLPDKILINTKIKENIRECDYEEYHNLKIIEIARKILSEQGYREKAYKGILEPFFLIEEYHRVVYGFQVTTKNEYLEVERKGRGLKPKLDKNSLKRAFIWQVFCDYSAFLKNNKIDSFTIRRFRLRQYLEKNQIPDTDKFDYIFVDELQDCTEADYGIFYKLLKNPNNLVLTGDLAQSIHIGSSSKTPRDEGLRRFTRPKLEGSFRLPFRISECILELSKIINTKRAKADNDDYGEIINPFKGSPPGARPIIFYAKTQSQLQSKIFAIFNKFKIYGINSISIFERDGELKNLINKVNIPATEETILQAKGMEKPCVLWSTRKPVQSDNEIYEFVYTILTRTSCLLIIVISDSTLKPYMDILRILKSERLIFWDKESKEKYQIMTRIGGVEEANEEELDDDDENTPISQNELDDVLSL